MALVFPWNLAKSRGRRLAEAKPRYFLLMGPHRSAEGTLMLQDSQVMITDFRICKDRIYASLKGLSKQKLSGNWSKLVREFEKHLFG